MSMVGTACVRKSAPPHGLVRYQRLELLNLVELHLPVLPAPVVVCRLADAQLLADLLNGAARSNSRVCLS